MSLAQLRAREVELEGRVTNAVMAGDPALQRALQEELAEVVLELYGDASSADDEAGGFPCFC